MSNNRTLVYLVEDPLLAQLIGVYLQTVLPGEVIVEKFSSFETALEQFRTSRTRPQIVYASMMHAKGLTLCGQIRAIDPTVRFILSSGSLPAGINESILQTDILPDAVLHKPFSLEQVQAMVRELLPGKPLLPLGVSKTQVWPFYPLEGIWRYVGMLPQRAHLQAHPDSTSIRDKQD